jgi:hypothetical protein
MSNVPASVRVGRLRSRDDVLAFVITRDAHQLAPSTETDIAAHERAEPAFLRAAMVKIVE